VKTIVLETHIDAPPEVCFDVSIDVDVHKESTRHTGERIVAGVTSGTMKLGDTVTFEARHFGVVMRLTSQIAECERPRRFVDKMVTGPFKSIWHEHLFEPHEGGTKMTDTFKFCAPLGPLGSVAESLFLVRYMRRLLEGRNAHIKRVAESRR
jgi:ligand-binding SRPBCC domain-containing protein